jgi:hypothetical protein
VAPVIAVSRGLTSTFGWGISKMPSRLLSIIICDRSGRDGYNPSGYYSRGWDIHLLFPRRFSRTRGELHKYLHRCLSCFRTRTSEQLLNTGEKIERLCAPDWSGLPKDPGFERQARRMQHDKPMYLFSVSRLFCSYRGVGALYTLCLSQLSKFRRLTT